MRPIPKSSPRFDHLELIRRDPMTVARLRATLERGGLLDVELLHESDDSCCRKEPWPATLAACLTGKPAPTEASRGH